MRSIAIAAFAVSLCAAPLAHARDWQPISTSGWLFDAKDIKTELKDGVAYTENTIVFQMRLVDASGAAPTATAEPTAQLYIACESRQYRLWDVATASQIGPMSTSLFDVAQTLEAYCDRIGKLPEDRKKRPGQR
jgi:hypothetical protein